MECWSGECGAKGRWRIEDGGWKHMKDNTFRAHKKSSQKRTIFDYRTAKAAKGECDNREPREPREGELSFSQDWNDTKEGAEFNRR